MFFSGSRYESVDTDTTTDEKGRTVRYKRIRFISAPDAQRTHEVSEEERLDHIAFEHYQDAERFWRICDANRALWPPDLVSDPGRTILIPPA